MTKSTFKKLKVLFYLCEIILSKRLQIVHRNVIMLFLKGLYILKFQISKFQVEYSFFKIKHHKLKLRKSQILRKLLQIVNRNTIMRFIKNGFSIFNNYNLRRLMSYIISTRNFVRQISMV